MKSKKLFIVYWDIDIGGIQKIIRDLVIHLDRTEQNFRIYLLIKQTANTQIGYEILSETNVTIYSYKDFARNPFINIFKFHFWIFLMYIKISPDIVLTFLDLLSMYMVILHKIFFWRNTRIVLNENTYTSNYLHMMRRPVWLWKMGISLFYRYADCIIVPGLACKEGLVSKFDIPEKIIRIGRNWTLPEKTRDGKKEYDLIYVGRFEKEKNVIDLITLTKQLHLVYPHITLCLLGKGKYGLQLKEQTKKYFLQNNIIFPGYRTNNIEYLRKAKIYVTTTFNEGVPLAILEAGSQKIPCVSSRFVGSEEIILHGKTGFIADSLLDMYTYIHSLLTDNNLRTSMGKHAQKYIINKYGVKNISTFIRYLLDK